MSVMNLAAYIKAACEAGRSSGEMLRSNMDTAREICYKGAVDIVTNFDNQSQKIIFDHLSKQFPEHDFLAEEGLCKNKGASFRWIFDPIDGTTNYAHKFPVFCVSIALEKDGDVLVGMVFDPIRDEMFTAIKGEGAKLNEKRIIVSSVDDLDKSLLATGFPYDVRESRNNNLNHFGDFIVRAQAIRRLGSAAIDLCYVACGRFDGFWELKLNPWDVAAGVLIMEEAAGRVTDFKGERPDIYGKELVASNGLIHDQMIDVLQMGIRSGEECGK